MLDVAAGQGNTALAASRRGALVTAIDLSHDQILNGRRRSHAEGIPVRWVEGDAEHLPFGDASFDAVLSSFGVEDGPGPDLASVEMFRVVRPGGMVGLCDWLDEGLVGRLEALAERFSSWKAEEGAEEEEEETMGWAARAVRDRLAAFAPSVEVRVEALRFRASSSFEEFWTTYLASDPDEIARQRQFDPAAYERWEGQLRHLFEEANVADDGTVAFDLHYLLVVGRKPI